MSKDRILNEATFRSEAVDYMVTSLTIGLSCTIVGIPLILIARPIARWYWNRFYSRLRVYLTTRDLKVHRGLFIREEKSIPLEKITDLAVVQGPIMRHYGVHGIRVETAGQSNRVGALVTVVGIEDVEGFRDLVLGQRDRITERDEPQAIAPSAPVVTDGAAVSDGVMVETMKDIRDTLRRIEERLVKQRT